MEGPERSDSHAGRAREPENTIDKGLGGIRKREKIGEGHGTKEHPSQRTR